jgi:hypothetical protein
MARRFCVILVFLALGLGGLRADTFQLVGGESVVGELLIASANDAGVQIKISDGDYKKVPWANFSQEDLKRLAKIPKLEALVEPFIEVTQEEKIKKTEVTIKQPPRLEHPRSGSILGAFFTSGLGVFLFLVLYAANIYAGYEVSIFRGQPTPLVCGVSAVLPIAGPIIFLSMRTKVPARAETWEMAAAAAAAAAPEAVNPMQADGPEHAGGLRIASPASVQAAASDEAPAEAPQAVEPQKPALPPSTTFKRGQFTFNRRFFETKFPGFFGVVRRDADRDMILLVKSARGEYIGTRIARISANEMHLQIQRGLASEEIMLPFQDIQEITLKHKDA